MVLDLLSHERISYLTVCLRAELTLTVERNLEDYVQVHSLMWLCSFLMFHSLENLILKAHNLHSAAIFAPFGVGFGKFLSLN